MGKYKQMQIDFDDDYVAKIKGLDDESEDDPFKDFAALALVVPDGLCKHKVKLTITRKTIVTYCTKCGKILCKAKR